MRMECLDCNKSLEDCTCIEDTIEFDKADIEVFIDGIFNPAEPNQALKDAAERCQERMYSEEDMIKSFIAGIKCESNNGKNFEQFIKQFKLK